MTEKELELIKLLAQSVWVHGYHKSYYAEKLKNVKSARLHDESILSIVGPMDDDNRAKLFKLGASIGLDIESMWRSVFYKEEKKSNGLFGVA